MKTVRHLGLEMSLPESSKDIDSDQEAEKVAKQLLAAMAKYLERNSERKSVWRRSGLRGQTQNVFAKGERAFMQVMEGDVPNVDNFIDAIVYSTFALILMEDHSERLASGYGTVEETQEILLRGLLNGYWPWDGS